MKAETQKELTKYQRKIGKRFLLKTPLIGYGELEEVKHRGFPMGLFTILDPEGNKTNVSVWKEMDKTKELK